METRNFDPRRRILAKSVVVGLAAAALPIAARADAPDVSEKNVIFTADNLGHWQGFEALHVPVVTANGGTLTIKTPHPMSAAHYIVSHSVVLADGTFVSRKTFTPTDQPISEHILPTGYSGGVIVTSTCNQHDFWVKRLSV